jgi:hypothetical protein
MAQVKCTHVDKEQYGYCPECYKVYQYAWDLHDASVRDCPDCQAVERAHVEYVQQHDTIDPSQPWGQHIKLTCKNHPDMTWHTKNISYIGARSIFYTGEWGTECDCPASDLVVVPVSAKAA